MSLRLCPSANLSPSIRGIVINEILYQLKHFRCKWIIYVRLYLNLNFAKALAYRKTPTNEVIPAKIVFHIVARHVKMFAYLSINLDKPNRLGRLSLA